MPHLDGKPSLQGCTFLATRLDSKRIFFGLADIRRIAINHARFFVEFHSRGQFAAGHGVALHRCFVSIPRLNSGKLVVCFLRCFSKVSVKAIVQISGGAAIVLHGPIHVSGIFLGVAATFNSLSITTDLSALSDELELGIFIVDIG